MKPPADIQVPARLEFLPELLSFVRSLALYHGFEEHRASEIVLAAEEALANIIHYAYPDEVRDVHLRAFHDEKSLKLEITDTGIPFDLLSSEKPDFDVEPDERAPGGLGVFLITELMDDVSYRRDGNRNVLRLTARKEGP